ncbi:MAG: hypothetical protein IT289_10260, partial [Oligoflexia bacterium]|nr:hypothetical protein [Oligoflexia bacterium]
MNLLGLSGFYHDSAACIVVDGQVKAAIQEERLSRIKHDASFPKLAARQCLDQLGLTINDIDHVFFYEKPFLKFDRLLTTHFNEWPRSFSPFTRMLEAWLGTKVKIPRIISKQLSYNGPIGFAKHHESHAASTFYCSPFDEATIVTLDGVGEWATGAIHHGTGDQFKTLREQHYPNSLGLFYSTFTAYLGFEVNDGEYKVMGLAPYGKPIYKNKLLEQVVKIQDDGSLKINEDYFRFNYSDGMPHELRLTKLLGVKPRKPSEPIQTIHQDLAASVQAVLEDAVFKTVKFAISLTGQKRVCLAGGVALNCTANGKLLHSGLVDDLFIQPASGDAGGAIGAALFGAHMILGQKRHAKALPTVYLGPNYDQKSIDEYLQRAQIPHEKLTTDGLVKRVAQEINNQKVVGWFQGAMEFGPRALGNRSILGDPRAKENWIKINKKVKFREDFRPLAP